MKNCGDLYDINLLQRKIENLRNTAKSWSPKTYKLVTQLKKKGLEILNSQMDGQTVVVWIWCRSQVALQNMQRIYESNQLTEIFLGLTNIRAPDCEVSKLKLVNIYRTQLRKHVGKFLLNMLIKNKN